MTHAVVFFKYGIVWTIIDMLRRRIEELRKELEKCEDPDYRRAIEAKIRSLEAEAEYWFYMWKAINKQRVLM